MKFFITLLALINSGLLLLAQNTGQTGGGSSVGGQRPAESIPAQVTPAQTSPVDSSPLQATPRFAAPTVGGGLGGGQQGPLGIPQSEANGAPGLSAPSQTDDGVDGGIRPVTPSGVDRLNPVVPPLTNSVPPPIRSGFQSQPLEPEVIDPSGASIDANQDALGTASSSEGVRTLSNDALAQRFRDDAFSLQFQDLASRSGTSQMAFPQENAVITIVSQDGNLTLQGTVGSEEDRENIERAFRGISSAGFIDNQLQVTPGSNAD